MIPKSLKIWFSIHFLADMAFAIPLMIAPIWFLTLFGWTSVDPFVSRLVAAALFGIGGVSLLARQRSVESFKSLLDLKIIWSITAVIGMVVSLFQGSPSFGWVIVLIFTVFSGVWMYYRNKIKNIQ